MEVEEWKILEHYSNYQISNLGRVKHIKRNMLLKGTLNGDGYTQVSLVPNENEKGLKKKPLRLHRLVAILFCSNDNPETKNIVNHLNANKIDNRSVNLEWTTNLENTRHASNNNLLKATNQRAVERICLKTDEIKKYESITEAFLDNKDILKYDTYIINVCSGKQKTTGGYKWKYISEFEDETEPENAKEIEGYENYMVTNTGSIYSKVSKKFLNPSLNGSGYFIIDLCANDYDEKKKDYEYTRKRTAKRKKFRVHYLVAKHFLVNDDFDLKTQVNHKDKNRQNNNYLNLEWVSAKENLQHAHNKPVIKYDENYNILETYESILQASKANEINASTLSSSIRRQTLSSGFYFKLLLKP
jgi:hypothetical protein